MIIHSPHEISALRAAFAKADQGNKDAARDRRLLVAAGQRDPLPVAAAQALRITNDEDSALMREARESARLLRRTVKHAQENRQDIDETALQPQIKGITAAFNRHSFSRAYDVWAQSCRAEIITALCTHNMFRDMAAEWGRRDNTTRLHSVHWFSKNCQIAFARDIMIPRVVEIGTMMVDDQILAGHDAPRAGESAHILTFNLHPDAGLADFFETIDSAFHENWHVVQAALGMGYARGLITEGHPLYRDARFLAMACTDQIGYISDFEDTYYAHPTERDAHAQTRDFIDELREAMIKHRLPLPHTQHHQFRF